MVLLDNALTPDFVAETVIVFTAGKWLVPPSSRVNSVESFRFSFFFLGENLRENFQSAFEPCEQKREGYKSDKENTAANNRGFGGKSSTF